MIGWSAIACQLLLYFLAGPFSTAGLLIALFRFFTFFTILANLVVALTLTAFARKTSERLFFARPSVAIAAAVYIVIVALVYTGFLRWQWHPTGLQLVVDRLLHDVMPTAYLLFWWRYVPKGYLRRSHIWTWLLFPLAFLPYNSLCSHIAGANPYPFLDVGSLGYLRVLGCIALLTVLLLFIGFLLVAVDHHLALPQPRECRYAFLNVDPRLNPPRTHSPNARQSSALQPHPPQRGPGP